MKKKFVQWINQFKDNLEEFIKAVSSINNEKATAIIQHITYDMMNEKYEMGIFTDPTIEGRLGVNAMNAKKHLYDHVVYDVVDSYKSLLDIVTK